MPSLHLALQTSKIILNIVRKLEYWDWSITCFYLIIQNNLTITQTRKKTKNNNPASALANRRHALISWYQYMSDMKYKMAYNTIIVLPNPKSDIMLPP